MLQRSRQAVKSRRAGDSQKFESRLDQSARSLRDRDIESQRLDQVRRQLAQACAFGERFADEMEVGVLEIPQSAVNRPRRPRGRPKGDVELFDDPDVDTVEQQLAGRRQPLIPAPRIRTLGRPFEFVAASIMAGIVSDAAGSEGDAGWPLCPSRRQPVSHSLSVA